MIYPTAMVWPSAGWKIWTISRYWFSNDLGKTHGLLTMQIWCRSQINQRRKPVKKCPFRCWVVRSVLDEVKWQLDWYYIRGELEVKNCRWHFADSSSEVWVIIYDSVEVFHYWLRFRARAFCRLCLLDQTNPYQVTFTPDMPWMRETSVDVVERRGLFVRLPFIERPFN